MSTRFASFYHLLRDDVDWFWTTECDQAISEHFKGGKVLVHYDATKPIVLACDASQFGVSAVLAHVIDGVERPVAYASRTSTSDEKNYSQIERKALAIEFDVTKFSKYLYGRKIWLLTDHEDLNMIF